MDTLIYIFMIPIYRILRYCILLMSKKSSPGDPQGPAQEHLSVKVGVWYPGSVKLVFPPAKK